jgi:hypothetical protein
LPALLAAAQVSYHAIIKKACFGEPEQAFFEEAFI